MDDPPPKGMNGDHGAMWRQIAAHHSELLDEIHQAESTNQAGYHHLGNRIDRLYVSIGAGLLAIMGVGVAILGVLAN
tara:strand:+ start:2391 stop:2621 length:231 start_codon:yes stop_codon:yes gene_type:complete